MAHDERVPVTMLSGFLGAGVPAPRIVCNLAPARLHLQARAG